MSKMNAIRQLVSGSILSVCVAALFASCHQGPTMYQVSGRVKYKDGSIPKAPVCLVNFVPKKDAKVEVRHAATGQIGPDGAFSMYTRVSGDGVFPGEYGVIFNVATNPMSPVSLLDGKYTDSASPPYTIAVDHNVNDLEFTIEPLSGAGGAAK